MQRLLSQRNRNGASHWMSTVDEQKKEKNHKPTHSKSNDDVGWELGRKLTSLVLRVQDFLRQRWSSSSELSPQSLSPSHFQWGWTHTWFLHSNRNEGQYVPLGKRVAGSQNHSVKIESATKLTINHQRGTNSWCRTLTTGCFICVVQTVGVAVTFEAFSDTVSTAALEVTRMTSPQLWNNNQKPMKDSQQPKSTSFFFIATWEILNTRNTLFHKSHLEKLDHIWSKETWTSKSFICCAFNRHCKEGAEWINYFWIDDYWWSCLSMLKFYCFFV